ncbi:hypothetical protein PTI45_03961 [Paenibacillus nuruki]|uniref:Uncharacterized protein n=1 Tax=Paenibacillus nuruki TaxID=1886670 RepID=A0A1E3KYP5_9BACL|nr:hypothetical protein [Paenibacillus nuruki]ODP26682.1 hypothetical protein PTI45_03961 [Paenibacillus nuruki]
MHITFIKSFHPEHTDLSSFRKDSAMPVITIYSNTPDYPNKFIGRLWVVHKGIHQMTRTAVITDSYKEMIKAIPTDMTLMPTHPKDKQEHPEIVETWYYPV